MMMKHIVRMAMAAGLALAGASFGGLGASAAPVTTGLQATSEAAAAQASSLVAGVAYHRGRHYRRVVYRARPVQYRRAYYPRPIYYRPVRARPIYAPVRYGYGPRCVIRWRTVYTWQGVIQKPVRVCRW